ncbi:hemerythrin domain-containing protein [Thermophagus xiamenensis]|jgi:regulator of cell morphogenesis and NO signaling|uniref:Regulator of cell morphogenesis and NO signaling n=1 Tax=Thermophagus xiamenensis TaxID=385682 RepID=A0A1I2DGT8_9BACT|nr:hemerythrin domain-containing protein [Thermophagus xiamenensis]SFE79734.1 regulator of cell morphogenesis and NO signaling [Thermophagus xiamenensis]
MHIHPHMKMSDLVKADFELLAVLQRLKIPFGFKDKSIQTVCREEGIDLNFFLNLAKWFHERDFFPGETLMNHPVKWLVKYLRSTHSCYIDYQIPRIESEIIQIENTDQASSKNMQLMLKFFREYISEFTAHIQLEEEKIFPYILELEENLEKEKPDPEFLGKARGYTIRDFLDEHSDIEEKLTDLRNILLKYLDPPSNNCMFTNILIEIFRLGKDLNDHTILEENVLIPQVIKLEEQFHQKFPEG